MPTLPPLPAPDAPLDDAARDRIAECFAAICVEAGAIVMEVYRAGGEARLKADRSPVTEADERAEALILARLAERLPGWPVLAEEAASAGQGLDACQRFILVDPLDGTREFVNRNGEFTVNIGLVADGVPVAGAVYAPVLERLWSGGAAARLRRVAPGASLAEAAEDRAIRTRPAPEAGWTALASRSHGDPETEALLARLPVAERRSAGSSMKFCVVAEGGADVYPRFGPTMEWDTAAGEAVLRAAGGTVLRPDGAPFRYGKAEAGYRNGAFVAWGDPAASGRSEG
ncbi:3'(2'),5'-bisphosphate nucleotidase CysQ [Lichenibacterium dinghuense]|uniref:3'(2'),5'-bisphosphate nucleotidase CysQ n=1 Tax=Lichenibacterium dinghuense TaxID=2895977 RepID=UPI001F01F865|nr:3'(2'),5'-bisphosphate nucleotidase CysQ [Lichenibacterium sp. 6Y81]